MTRAPMSKILGNGANVTKVPVIGQIDKLKKKKKKKKKKQSKRVPKKS